MTAGVIGAARCGNSFSRSLPWFIPASSRADGGLTWRDRRRRKRPGERDTVRTGRFAYPALFRARRLLAHLAELRGRAARGRAVAFEHRFELGAAQLAVMV